MLTTVFRDIRKGLTDKSLDFKGDKKIRWTRGHRRGEKRKTYMREKWNEG